MPRMLAYPINGDPPYEVVMPSVVDDNGEGVDERDEESDERQGEDGADAVEGQHPAEAPDRAEAGESEDELVEEQTSLL